MWTLRARTGLVKGRPTRRSTLTTITLLHRETSKKVRRRQVPVVNSPDATTKFPAVRLFLSSFVHRCTDVRKCFLALKYTGRNEEQIRKKAPCYIGTFCLLVEESEGGNVVQVIEANSPFYLLSSRLVVLLLLLLCLLSSIIAHNTKPFSLGRSHISLKSPAVRHCWRKIHTFSTIQSLRISGTFQVSNTLDSINLRIFAISSFKFEKHDINNK